MSGSGLPPEVPEEYGEAYRKAYEKAMADQPPLIERLPPAEADVVIPRREVPAAGAHRAPVAAVEPTNPRQPFTQSSFFVPALLLLAALVLIGVAYGLGRALSDDSSGPRATPAAPGSPSKPATGPAYQGTVTSVAGVTAKASCTAPAGRDSAGRRVTYGVGMIVDGDTQTAWRCPGKAIGQRIVLGLPAGTKVAELGLIPGYAKTDPRSGTDRYAENNRITRVRWTLPDGSTVDQKLNPDPSDRSMRSIRVPVSSGGRVVLQILSVTTGSRDTTMISEIHVGAAS